MGVPAERIYVDKGLTGTHRTRPRARRRDASRSWYGPPTSSCPMWNTTCATSRSTTSTCAPTPPPPHPGPADLYRRTPTPPG